MHFTRPHLKQSQHITLIFPEKAEVMEQKPFDPPTHTVSNTAYCTQSLQVYCGCQKYMANKKEKTST